MTMRFWSVPISIDQYTATRANSMGEVTHMSSNIHEKSISKLSPAKKKKKYGNKNVTV